MRADRSVWLRRESEEGLSSTLLPGLCLSLQTRTKGADFTLTVSRSELSSDSDSLVCWALLRLGLSEWEGSGLELSIANIVSSWRVRGGVLEGLWVDLAVRCLPDDLWFTEGRARTDLSLDLYHHGWVGALCAASVCELKPFPTACLFNLSVFLRVCLFVCLSVCLLVEGRSESWRKVMWECVTIQPYY